MGTLEPVSVLTGTSGAGRSGLAEYHSPTVRLTVVNSSQQFRPDVIRSVRSTGIWPRLNTKGGDMAALHELLNLRPIIPQSLKALIRDPRQPAEDTRKRPPEVTLMARGLERC
jgi:hypothetical protein